MGTSIFSMLVILVVSIVTSGAMASSDYNQELTSSSNKFALNLYQNVTKEGENMVCSPFGLQVLLANILQGAGGTTEKEIASVLYHSKDNENILKGYSALMNGMKASKDLNLATRLFIEKSFKVKPEFLSVSSKYFLTDVKDEDFEQNPKESRIDINNWAEEKTNQKIKNLLPEESITKDTTFVLVNAIHFKANWSQKFNKDDTADMPFYVTPDHPVNVPMMVLREKKFRYTESANLDAKILELPYEGGMFSMVIILPKEVSGLSAVERKLININLKEELDSLEVQTVNVMVPRFKIEKTLDLNEVLQKQMPSAFRGANFTGISDEPIQISKVIQKAFIEVNEEGTEAAAATAVMFATYSGTVPKPTPEFKCDRPFISLIFYKPNNNIIFVSRIRVFK